MSLTPTACDADAGFERQKLDIVEHVSAKALFRRRKLIHTGAQHGLDIQLLPALFLPVGRPSVICRCHVECS
jgi:hypothetical protein